MPHDHHAFYDPSCVLCRRELDKAQKAGRQMWQGSSVAVLQTVYNLLIDDEPKAAKMVIKTYLQHLGEWTD